MTKKDYLWECEKRGFDAKEVANLCKYQSKFKTLYGFVKNADLEFMSALKKERQQIIESKRKELKSIWTLESKRGIDNSAKINLLNKESFVESYLNLNELKGVNFNIDNL